MPWYDSKIFVVNGVGGRFGNTRPIYYTEPTIALERPHMRQSSVLKSEGRIYSQLYLSNSPVEASRSWDAHLENEAYNFCQDTHAKRWRIRNPFHRLILFKGLLDARLSHSSGMARAQQTLFVVLDCLRMPSLCTYILT